MSASTPRRRTPPEPGDGVDAADEPAAVERWRAETEGCAHVTHLNNAGASLPPRAVVEATVEHLRLEARIGGYEAAEAAAAALDRVPEDLGRLINADRGEIAIVENATRAWDMAFYSIPFEAGDVIVTGVAEYASNVLPFLQLQRQRGVGLEVCPDDGDGQLDLERLERLLRSRPVRLVALTHVPTDGGLVNPAAAVGRLAAEHGALFLLDACQSAGQLHLDVSELGCDLLSATSRKYLRGPRGMGFLYARAATTAALHPPFIDLHAATWVAADRYELAPGAQRFENWERNVAAQLGFGAAVRYALDIGVPLIERRVRALADRLRSQLGELPGVTVRDKGRDRCGIVTFTDEQRSPEQVQALLRAARINTSITRRSSTRFDLDARDIEAMTRASVHYYNTVEELDHLCATLRPR